MSANASVLSAISQALKKASPSIKQMGDSIINPKSDGGLSNTSNVKIDEKTESVPETGDLPVTECGDGEALAEGAEVASAMSDVRLKEVYQDIDDKIIENFALIDAIDFKYNEEAQSQYQNENHVDNVEHIGVKAQDLENNEATKGTVSENENGDKVVDTAHLALADTAAIAELSRRVLALETIVKELQDRA